MTMQAFGLILMTAATAISGCSSQTETTEVPVNPNPVVVEEPEPMSLAFASVSDSRAGSRLTNDVVQMNDATSYREIKDFYFIALKKEGSSISSVSNSLVRYGNSEDHLPIRYYHFSFCDMPRNTNGCLVYAKAEDKSVDLNDDSEKSDFERNIYNGCLAESPYISNNVNSTDQITFEPVSIYSDATVGDDGIHADAWTLANALTDIAQTQIEDVYWSASTNKDLKALFINFTNSGYDLPGSAASVKKWIEAVLVAATQSPSLLSFDDGTIEEQIRQEIIAKASAYLDKNNAISIFNLNYPQNINLPDGAAVVRWADTADGKKFVPQLQTTTLDDINSVSRFVYPPALYYFVESGIWTTSSKLEFSDYSNKSTWKGNDANSVQGYIKAENNGTEITEIREDTKTVAVADPLQYAVAQLQVKVKVADDADETNLKYNGTATIPYTDNGTNHYFRLTGVIIGGQRTVGYNFKPLTNSDMDVKFVYDSQVPGGFVLKKNSTDVFNTLVLQSYDGEDVNVILEFEYTGNTAFKCLNGWVYPNTRFYLVGEVKLSTGIPSAGVAAEDVDDVTRRVFTQDRITAIQMTVSSLEKAYNVLPSILSKNLEIGVLTTPQWIAATPADAVILE